MAIREGEQAQEKDEATATHTTCSCEVMVACLPSTQETRVRSPSGAPSACLAERQMHLTVDQASFGATEVRVLRHAPTLYQQNTASKHSASLAQLVEARGSNPRSSGFESQGGHQTSGRSVEVTRVIWDHEIARSNRAVLTNVASSSKGQDTGFSPQRRGFKSPRGYHQHLNSHDN